MILNPFKRKRLVKEAYNEGYRDGYERKARHYYYADPNFKKRYNAYDDGWYEGYSKSLDEEFGPKLSDLTKSGYRK